MHITSKRTSISRRPAALSVLVGLSLLGGVPPIVSQVAPTQAEALVGVGAVEGKETREPMVNPTGNGTYRRTRGSAAPSSRRATRQAG